MKTGSPSWPITGAGRKVRPGLRVLRYEWKSPRRYTRLTGFLGGAGSLIGIAGFEVVTVSDVHDAACFFKLFLEGFDGNVSGVDPLFRSH